MVHYNMDLRPDMERFYIVLLYDGLQNATMHNTGNVSSTPIYGYAYTRQ